MKKSLLAVPVVILVLIGAATYQAARHPSYAAHGHPVPNLWNSVPNEEYDYEIKGEPYGTVMPRQEVGSVIHIQGETESYTLRVMSN